MAKGDPEGLLNKCFHESTHQLIVTEYGISTYRPVASVMRITKSKVPRWVGVPERVPPEDKVSPGGRPGECGARTQVKGALAPMAVKVMVGYGSIHDEA